MVLGLKTWCVSVFLGKNMALGLNTCFILVFLRKCLDWDDLYMFSVGNVWFGEPHIDVSYEKTKRTVKKLTKKHFLGVVGWGLINCTGGGSALLKDSAKDYHRRPSTILRLLALAMRITLCERLCSSHGWANCRSSAQRGVCAYHRPFAPQAIFLTLHASMTSNHVRGYWITVVANAELSRTHLLSARAF